MSMHWVQKDPGAVCSWHWTWTGHGQGAEQAKVEAETKDKTRRRHFPPASTEPWKDLPKILGRTLSLQNKLKLEFLAHQLSSMKL